MNVNEYREGIEQDKKSLFAYLNKFLPDDLKRFYTESSHLEEILEFAVLWHHQMLKEYYEKKYEPDVKGDTPDWVEALNQMK